MLARDCTHVLLIDGDLQHLPEEAPLLMAEAERTGADVVLGERRFDRRAMPASRYHANRIGSLALSRFMGVAVRDTQCGFRLFRARRAARAAAEGARLRHRNGDAREAHDGAAAGSPQYRSRPCTPASAAS